jgi:hypothetical protein
MTISQIRTAIRHESDASPKSTAFKVLAINPSKFNLYMELQAVSRNGGPPAELDEQFKGSVARWFTGSVESTATVFNVDTDSGVAALRDVRGQLPKIHQTINLVPTDFLWALKKCWADDGWAQRAIACLDDFTAPKLTNGVSLSSANIARLRPAQRKAFALLAHDMGFLFGPPGSGKTTLLGEMLGSYLQANPNARVLVLCTTNRAVDEVTISVDTALARAGQLGLRHCIKRMGPGYSAPKFKDREHLLPDEAGQGSIDARLISSTVTRAIMTLGTLRELPQFDLLVMDEASQVSLAHTLAVMPLGKIRLFAGDPNQLAPVSLANTSFTQRWIAKSSFEYMPKEGPNVCLLNEQSRMAEAICNIVSTIFYNGALRVADDALNSTTWLHQRKLKFADIPRSQHVSIQRIDSDATKATKSRKFVRMESANRIVSMIQTALENRDVDGNDIVVITAFRKQLKLIRSCLHAAGIKGIQVDTVHRSQGMQAPVVIFDPVSGIHPLLMNDRGRQLINVAISRAQAKLIVMLSKTDAKNPTFAQMLEIVAKHNDRPIRAISQVLSDPTFLTSAIGQRVRIDGQVADITRFSSNGSIMWADIEATGAQAMFDTQTLR